MRNRLRRPTSFFFSVISIVGLAAVTGCGDKELVDKEYGFIDLAPYYYDGATPSTPTAGIPRELKPSLGWVNGLRAEYYDFGLVGTVKKRTSTSTPDYAVVNPMFFFFDTARQPLFSKPEYERRTGLWHMRGGKDALNPNPSNGAGKDVPYSVRVRDYLVDDKRMTADYQRPIVDRIHHNTDYTGLWEIVEVTVPDGYTPDDIKSLETLKRAYEEGKFEDLAPDDRLPGRRTGKVINCPILDDRTYVVPTPLYYGMPTPQIEIWYKTKRGRCFLADGWLALGTRQGALHPANSDGNRLNTFDIISFKIGEDEAARQAVIAPVSKIYVPKVTVANQDPSRTATDIRYPGDFLSEVVPKLTPADPPGYRPIRWMHDINVPQDPPFISGTFKNITQTENTQLVARTGPFTKNFPLIGLAWSCKTNDDCKDLKAGPGVILQCNLTPNENVFANEAIAAGRDGPTGTVVTKEGGPRCDVPAVRFAEYCAPGIARCALDQKDTSMFGGPELTCPDPPLKPNESCTPAKAVITPAGPLNIPQVGYACLPTNSGYCYHRCDVDAGASAKAIRIAMKYKGPDGADIDYADPSGVRDAQGKPLGKLREYDARCGNMPGYKCLNPSGTPAPPTKMRVCVRTCSTSDPDAFNDVYCNTQMNVTINEKVSGNIQKGMTCSNRGGPTACTWDPAFEPRDPNTKFVPR